MLAHLAGFSFLDPTHIGSRIHYLGLLSSLEDGGLDGVLDAVRDLVRGLGATLLVIDGTRLLEDLAPSSLDFRRFTAQLQAQSAMHGCTTVLLTRPTTLPPTSMGPSTCCRNPSPPGSGVCCGWSSCAAWGT
jgi:hypothetical protein